MLDQENDAEWMIEYLLALIVTACLGAGKGVMSSKEPLWEQAWRSRGQEGALLNHDATKEEHTSQVDIIEPFNKAG